MKKLFVLLIAFIFVACSCSTPGNRLETNNKITIQLEDNFLIEIELIEKENEYFDVLISKTTSDNYFTFEDDHNDKERCSYDLAIRHSNIEYITVNENEDIKNYTFFSGGVYYGSFEVFPIESFEDTIKIRIHIPKELQKENYDIIVQAHTAQDYGVQKCDATGNRHADSVIKIIKFIVE